jgi:hypothetical protein
MFGLGVAVVTNSKGQSATPPPLDQSVLVVDVDDMGTYIHDLLGKEVPIHVARVCHVAQ